MTYKKCPICSSTGNKTISLTDKKLRGFYLQNYSPGIPKSVQLGNFTIRRCSNCSLEWSDPMLPGNDGYYSWITQQKNYYAPDRWEWRLLFSLITNPKSTLLEVGCGSGKFLSLCRDEGIGAEGIDLTASAVKVAKAQGLRAYCCQLKDFVKTHTKKYDYVVAFHLFEHVSDPVSVLKDMISLLKPDGKIYISTPYTHRQEGFRFEYLNYPPHHLTRWNRSAYESLAKRHNLKMRFLMPHNNYIRTLPHRYKNEMSLILYGPSSYLNVGYLRIIIDSIRHPILSIKVFLYFLFPEMVLVDQLDSSKSRKQPADYVCLVELSRA